jgi:hypothetical protein
MASKHGSGGTREHARSVAGEGVSIRDRVRDLTVGALRDLTLRPGAVSGVVEDVLDGVSSGVAGALPEARRRAWREAFEGMNEAMSTLGSSAARTARGVQQRGADIWKKDVRAATRGLRGATDEFLHAVGSFARRVSGEAREELESMVNRSRRAGSRAGESARHAMDVFDGGLIETSGEAVRAGVAAVRGAASGLAMATGGLLEGLGEVAAPSRSAPARRARPARAARRRTKKKPGRRTVRRRALRRKRTKRKTGAKRRRARR